MTTKTQQNTHLKLWTDVEQTPTNMIKAAKVDGQQMTTLHHMHIVRKATEMFGPVGIGWGYDITEERFDQGAPILDPKTGAAVAFETTHTVLLTVWYKWGNETGRVSNYGHTTYIYRTRDGRFKTDGEAPKKSISDAIKKCFSFLGFSADVYTGRFDDEQYLADRNTETGIEMAEDQDAAIEKAREEYQAWISKQVETIRELTPHVSAINLLLDKALNRIAAKAHVARVNPDKGAAMLRRAAEQGTERVKAEQAAKREKQEAEKSTQDDQEKSE